MANEPGRGPDATRFAGRPSGKMEIRSQAGSGGGKLVWDWTISDGGDILGRWKSRQYSNRLLRHPERRSVRRG